MSKKPPSMVEFNFQQDSKGEEPLVLELNDDADDADDFDSYEDELIQIEEKEKPNEKDIFENIPESPVAQHKPLDELKEEKTQVEQTQVEQTQVEQTKTKTKTKTKKPRKPMSEEHKQKLALAREKAMMVRKQKAEEKKKMKALDNEEKELLKKQKFKKVQKLKEEVEEDKPLEKSKNINNISGLTKKDLEDAQLEAIMKYDAMRKERKAKKKQDQIIEEGKNKMLNNIQRATGQYSYRDGSNRFDSCY